MSSESTKKYYGKVEGTCTDDEKIQRKGSLALDGSRIHWGLGRRNKRHMRGRAERVE